MKKGDVVTIDDSSYSRSVIDGKLTKESLAYGIEKGKKYVVIEIGCNFPNTGCIELTGPTYIKSATFNNTVIQAIDSGKVVFIEERFLELVPQKHKVMIDIEQISYAICGNVVEISDKLYQEIKRDSQPK